MLTLDEILERIRQSEDELAEFRERAIGWERMWRLDPGFTKGWREAVEEDGREEVATPDPMNIVSLAGRLIDDTPKIDVPPRSDSDEDLKRAAKVEKWLKGFWQYLNMQQGRNILEDAKWYALVRGCFFFEVLWAKELYPKKMRKSKFPILVRVLDPMNTAVKRGPLYTEWAYHRYVQDLAWVRQRYPDLLDDLKWSVRHDPNGILGEDLAHQVTITDFWYTDSDGEVWNAILVDDRFGKEPEHMESYPAVPILEGFGDTAPTYEESFRRLSILAPIDGLWQYKCRLVSLMGTAVLWFTWPFTTIQSPGGELPPDFEIRPGDTRVVPADTKIDHHVPPINLNVLQTITTAVDAAIQQSSFPAVMYGDPSGIQSGYGVNILQQASINRVDTPRTYMEMMVREVNERVLCMIDENAGKKGVSLYARDYATNAPYSLTLTPNDIDGYYCNLVTLVNTVAQDEIAKINILSMLADKGYLSRDTVRQNIDLIEVPPDEEGRISVEQAMNSQDLAPRKQIADLIVRYPDTWQLIVKGTMYEKAAKDLGLLEEEQPPPGFHKMPDGSIMPDSAMQPQGPPPGGPPPPMGPGGPPMGPQPPSMPTNPDGSPIVPPVMQGQIMPQDMGLPLTGMANVNQAMMGSPMPPGEELQYLLGQQ